MPRTDEVLLATQRDISRGDGSDLERHVRPVKRKIIKDLIDAIRQSPEAIDAWIEGASRQLPFVQDRGYAAVGDGQPEESRDSR
jgi:hypothetical protein